MVLTSNKKLGDIIRSQRATIKRYRKIINTYKRFQNFKDNKGLIKKIFEEFELRGYINKIKNRGKIYYQYRMSKNKYDGLKKFFGYRN